MNYERKCYAHLWPHVWRGLWILRMLCAGVSMGLFTKWLNTKISWGWWNIVISISVMVAVYFVTEWFTGWLAFLFKFLFSKLVGYRFDAFAYHWVYINRKKGKLKIKKAKVYHKRGMLIMLPPTVEGERYNLLLYWFGGSIGLILIAILGLAIFYVSPEKETAGMAILLFSCVLTLLNSADWVLEQVLVEWDTLVLGFQPWNKRVRRIMLQITYSSSMGERLWELPKEWFTWEPWYAIVDSNTEWLACYRFQYLYYHRQYKEAESFAEAVFLPGMCLKKVRFAVAVRLLFIKMTLYDDVEMIRQYYESEKEILGYSEASEDYRSLYLYLKYIDKQPEAAEKYRVLWEKELENQEERDRAPEIKDAEFVEKKWGDIL